MIVSEARIAANQANAQASTGPTSTCGKEASRRGSLKHGLTGKGVVVPPGDREEIDRRIASLAAELKPMSTAGVFLISQMAMLSVRAENAARQESAAIAMNVRHAADAFDEEQIDLAEALFDALGEDPRNNLRKLKKSPEGVERLIDGWHDLRNDLTIDPNPSWSAAHLERAGHMTGLKSQHARGSRFGALSRAIGGDFAALGEDDGGQLDENARRDWAKSALFELIDAQIAALEAHYQTLDFEMIDLDRAEAGARALFDSSKKATLARRYEADARRSFYKALKEFRLVEAEFQARAEAAPSVPPTSQPSAQMGSSREIPPPKDREPSPPTPVDAEVEICDVQDENGQRPADVPPGDSPG